MKKILSFLVVLIIVFGGVSAVGFTLSKKGISKHPSIYFSNPIIKTKEKYISINLPETTTFTWETGMPMLPVYTKVYTFSFGTIIENVKVTFSDTHEQKISKLIRPVPESHIVSIYASHEIEERETEVDYSDIDIYPEQQFNYRTGVGLKNLKHVTILSVHLYPIQYNPQENKIYYSKSATIDVTYTPPKNIINFQDVYDFLIITPAEFKSALQPLVDLKNQNEIDTFLVTLDDVYEGTYFPVQGIDNQEKIKYFIKNAIEQWNIHYLLLVGSGIVGEEKFPVRYSWIPDPPYESDFPSVLYYADIYKEGGIFADWDYNNNSVYGEYPFDTPDVDIYPDVCLGFLPCSKVREVETIVKKITNYKTYNKMTYKILQIGGDTTPEDNEGIYEGEFANERVLEKLPKYNTTRLWASENNISKQKIADGFKYGVDFVDFSGHGGSTTWGTHPPNKETWVPRATFRSPSKFFLNIDFDLYLIYNNKKLPVVVYNACSNNKWTESKQCLGYKTISQINGGGIAAYGASCIIYTLDGSHQCDKRWGWCEVQTFKGLYNEKILGIVWNNVITDYVDNFSSLQWDRKDQKTVLGYSMFGDPTLVIEDGEKPRYIPKQRPFPTLEWFLNLFPRLLKILGQILA